MASSKEEPEEQILVNKGNFELVYSTGSTLLDLSISGGREETGGRGGVPAGIVIEVFGKSSAGKTALVVELAKSVQDDGGSILYVDPEARLDHEYARMYGLNLPKENYYKPDTVTEMFDIIWNWKTDPNKGHLLAADSLAAFSTDMELEGEDKMGMRRAKEFSQGFRKTCRMIQKNNWIIACTNQQRTGPHGDFTPGGAAAEFHASLRIKLAPAYPQKYIKKEITVEKKKISETIGVITTCTIDKSSLDNPYRTANIYIIFGYGIDDIRGNLQYTKEYTGSDSYGCDVLEEGVGTMPKAIQLIEERGLESALRDRTVELWHSIQDKLKVDRKRKVRF